jgi:hypothetical protein
MSLIARLSVCPFICNKSKRITGKIVCPSLSRSAVRAKSCSNTSNINSQTIVINPSRLSTTMDPLMAPSTTVKPLYEPSIRRSWKSKKGTNKTGCGFKVAQSHTVPPVTVPSGLSISPTHTEQYVPHRRQLMVVMPL